MPIITYPLNEKEYSAEDAAMYNFAISSGVASQDDFRCAVSGLNNIVSVGVGIGWLKVNRFGGLVIGQRDASEIDIGLPDAINPRIDVVAIQFNIAENGSKIIVKNGTASANPVIPARTTTESIYEIYLCSIYRKPGATAVTPSDVTDLRLDAQYCGLMANSITKIDTAAINAQVQGLINDLRQALNDVEQDTGIMLAPLWSDNGAIRLDKGGTGATNGADGLKNLLSSGYTVLSPKQVGTEVPDDLPEYGLFFKVVN